MKDKAMVRMLNSLMYQVEAEYDAMVISEQEWTKKIDGISIADQVTEDIHFADTPIGKRRSIY